MCGQRSWQSNSAQHSSFGLSILLPPNKAFKLSGSLYLKARKDFNRDHTLPSWKAFTAMLHGEVIWKHSQANLSAPSPHLPSNAQLTTRASTPSCQEVTSHLSCLTWQRPLHVTTALAWPGIHVSSGQRRGRSNQSEENSIPLFSHLSHSTAGRKGRRGTLISL